MAVPIISGICHVLDEDRDLAESVPLARRGQAAQECIARVVSMPVGGWQNDREEVFTDGVGLLLLGGLLIRRVGIDSRFGAELLGEGDLMRPYGAPPSTLQVTTGWRVLEPARVAVLDEAFAARVTRHPELIGGLVARALQRSRTMSVTTAIVHHARVDVRLHMLLWQLAARWGRVRSDGVSLPLRLTHNVLADLAAASRPTVTSALSELARRGLVEAVDGGWLLHGDPPGELRELAPLPQALTAKPTADGRREAI
jgi:CRP/FNR family cyclic AMP-dependent transcriptional regulator